jgi:hypothetical protein
VTGKDSRDGDASGPAAQPSPGVVPPSFGSHLPSETDPAAGAGAGEFEPAVGWYPSRPAGPPSAGPFAAPVTSARRRIGPLRSRPARGAGSARAVRPSRAAPAARYRRSRLGHVLLFGIGPLVVIGGVVAAFLLVSPGQGSASNLGFQAGPAATGAASASPSASPTVPPSSPAAYGQRHPRAAPSAAVAKVPTISTARPKVRSSPGAAPKPAAGGGDGGGGGGGGGGGVTPHNLGLPSFDGYCQHIGDRSAVLVADNAYGWRCTLNTGHVLLATDVCAWTYHLSASQVVSVSTNYGDPNAWQCWRVNRLLGVLNVGNYCVTAGLGASELVADDAYGWYCTTPPTPVNTTIACDTVYHVTDAVARFAVFADPYSWQCYA